MKGLTQPWAQAARVNDLSGFRPDPKPAPTSRKDIRVKDVSALRFARLAGDECVACGTRKGSAHHVVQKGSPHLGDDVAENIVLLCGSGSDRCHGAFHGSPYALRGERRDAAWVGNRIGLHLIRHRPDVIAYVVAKFGSERAASAYLERFYCVRLDDDRVWRQAPCAAPDAPAAGPGTLTAWTS